jgi:hypothetical protein
VYVVLSQRIDQLVGHNAAPRGEWAETMDRARLADGLRCPRRGERVPCERRDYLTGRFLLAPGDLLDSLQNVFFDV